MKKSEWLTIPDAPNYEINSALQVRNKKTGYLLTPRKIKNHPTEIVKLWVGNHQIIRTPKTFRAQAKAAVATDKWYPVPSLNNLYEFNKRAQLRNAVTKKLLSKHRDNLYYPRIGKKTVAVSVSSLNWEIFGILPPATSKIKRPVIISKGKTTLYFDRRIAAAKFIAAEEFFVTDHIMHLFGRRTPEICGWQINYLEDDTNVGDYIQGMQKTDPSKKNSRRIEQ